MAKHYTVILNHDGIDYVIKYQENPVVGWVAEYKLPSGEKDITGIFTTKWEAIKSTGY